MRNSFIVIVWLLIISLGVLGWLGQTQFGWWSDTQVAETTQPATDAQSLTTNRPADIQPSSTQAAETKTAETNATETKTAVTEPAESKSAEAPKPAETQSSANTTAAGSTNPADATKSAEAKEPAASSITPSFDIVRVEPDGTAVIAGRADPGASVSVLVDGKTVVKEKANERGEWTVVVENPIPPGNHNVTLSSDAGGKTVVSEQSIAIRLPDRKDEKPLIVLSKKGEASKILQAPEKTPASKPETQVAAKQPETAAPEASASAEAPAESAAAPATTAPAVAETTTTVAPAAAKPTGALALKTVDYDDQGNMIFTGTATPDEMVRIYVNNKPIADAKADLSGVWTLRVVKEVEPGNHNLRVDQLAKDSTVASRIELPFTRVDPERVIAALNQGKVPQVKQPSAAKTGPQDSVVEATESTAATASATATAPSGAESSTANTTAPASDGAAEPKTETAAAPSANDGTSIVAQALAPSSSSDSATASQAPAAPSEETPSVSAQPETATQDTATASAPATPQTPSSGTESSGAEAENQVAAVVPPAGTAISSAGSQTQTASTTTTDSSGDVVQRVGRVIIQPGNNLWNISRVIYGSGVSYTAIYQANKGQIRDPHLIYPGQIFTTPGVVPPEQIKP